MALVERTSVSGTALSYLLYECVNSHSSQEGFLFGNVTRDVRNHISDTRSDNARVEVVIDVTSTLPAPDTGLFYGPAGQLREAALGELLAGAAAAGAGQLVGWYRYRRNDLPAPTLRDRLVTRALLRLAAGGPSARLLCCRVTGRSTAGGSTHTFLYRFSQATRGSPLVPLPDFTGNLGEPVAGYRRAPPQAAAEAPADPFSEAVRTAGSCGAPAVAQAVRAALRAAAGQAAEHEVALRKVSVEVRHMAALLAEHHGARLAGMRPVRRTAARLRDERAVIRPLVAALAEPPPTPEPPRAEPFAFVADIMRDDLQRGPSGPSSPPEEPALPPRETKPAPQEVQVEKKIPNTRRWEKPVVVLPPSDDKA